MAIALRCSVFFGKKEEAPANLKRMTVKTFPDQYPAEKVLQAEPVEGDSKDAAVIRPLLRQTELGEEEDFGKERGIGRGDRRKETN